MSEDINKKDLKTFYEWMMNSNCTMFSDSEDAVNSFIDYVERLGADPYKYIKEKIDEGTFEYLESISRNLCAAYFKYPIGGKVFDIGTDKFEEFCSKLGLIVRFDEEDEKYSARTLEGYKEMLKIVKDNIALHKSVAKQYESTIEKLSSKHDDISKLISL